MNPRISRARLRISFTVESFIFMMGTSYAVMLSDKITRTPCTAEETEWKNCGKQSETIKKEKKLLRYRFCCGKKGKSILQDKRTVRAKSDGNEKQNSRECYAR